MSRIFVKSPEAKKLLEEHLIPGYIKFGSVRSLAKELNRFTTDNSIHSGRLFALFSGDNSQAINPGTFEMISAAAKRLDISNWAVREVHQEDPWAVRRFLNRQAGNDTPDHPLRKFITACEDLRASEMAAKGFSSGKLVRILADAKKQHTDALLAISAWAEEHAREELGEGSFHDQ